MQSSFPLCNSYGQSSKRCLSQFAYGPSPCPYATLSCNNGPKEVGPLLRAIDAYSGAVVTRAALRLAPLVFVRPGELRNATWDQIDFEKSEWRFISSKIKTLILFPYQSKLSRYFGRYMGSPVDVLTFLLARAPTAQSATIRFP